MCLVLSFGQPALADDAAGVRARSLALFKESALHYEAGRYSVAAALLEEAYALHPEPKLLYNLGRARESAGDVKGALDAYESYLRLEPASDRSVGVQQRIEQLRTRSDPAPDPTPAPETGDPPAEGTDAWPSQPPPKMQAAPTAERTPQRTVPWILVGSGGAVLGAALTLGLVARSGHRQAEQEAVQTRAVALQQTAERRALVANLLAGAGGALAIAGGAWLVFGGRRASSKREIASGKLAWEMQLGPSRIHYTLSF